MTTMIRSTRFISLLLLNASFVRGGLVDDVKR
ncbi:leu operon leader peptide [Pseudocitrobacter cyperus]